MSDPVIFLHIPKTAGTSFRTSAISYFGKANVLKDYGVESKNTSPDIINYFYNADDLESLREVGLSRKMLCGHFSLPRYREVFPASPVITFFRDPVKRVISEFVHFSNHYDYTGSLEDFYKDPKFQNRQHHILGGAKPTDLDFYGLTEQFGKSLEMFNQKYNTKLKMTELNKGTYSRCSVVKPTAEQIEEISHLNQADLALYTLALESFDCQANKPTTTAADMALRYRGNFGGIRDDKLCGWITDSQTRKPTVLLILVNGKVLTTTTANVERPDLVRNGIDKKGICGFEVPLQELGTIKPQDCISIMTQDGAFELPNSPLVMAA